MNQSHLLADDFLPELQDDQRLFHFIAAPCCAAGAESLGKPPSRSTWPRAHPSPLGELSSVRCKANVHGDCSSVKNPIFGCIFSLGLPGENPTVVPTRVAGFVCRKPYHLELLALCLVKNKMLGDRAESFKKAINRICVSSPGITRQQQKLLCMLCWRQHMATLRVRIKQHNLPLAEPAARGLHGRAQTPQLHCSVPWS